MEKIIELRTCVDSLSKDAHKFFNKNNKAAGVRARKKLQKCKKISQEIRIKIQKAKQENVQEKSAEISALAALNGGNNLTGEREFHENSSLPFPGDFGFVHFDQSENFSSPNFIRASGEIFTSMSWGQENFTEDLNPHIISSLEPSFYPPFEE